jgi:hypothetical protein
LNAGAQGMRPSILASGHPRTSFSSTSASQASGSTAVRGHRDPG